MRAFLHIAAASLGWTISAVVTSKPVGQVHGGLIVAIAALLLWCVIKQARSS